MSQEQIKNLNHRVSNVEKRVHALESVDAPRKQGAVPESPQGTTTQESNSTPRKTSSNIDVPPSPRNPDQSKERWYQTIKGWKTVAEIVGICSAIFYAGVTFLQWQDLRHNFMVEQRAWLSVKYAPLPDINGLAAVDNWPGTIANTGKIPASRIAVTFKLEILDKSQAPSLTFRGAQADLIPVLFPGDPTTFNALVEQVTDINVLPHKFSPDEIRRLGAGDAYIAVFSIAVYEDQFGPHWTRTCTYKAFKQGNWPTGRCITTWNAVGDGSPPNQ